MLGKTKCSDARVKSRINVREKRRECSPPGGDIVFHKYTTYEEGSRAPSTGWEEKEIPGETILIAFCRQLVGGLILRPRVQKDKRGASETFKERRHRKMKKEPHGLQSESKQRKESASSGLKRTAETQKEVTEGCTNESYMGRENIRIDSAEL